MTRLRIAMVGQRGVPATWGGIEHHVEELGARLADRGHEVTVFCRPGYVPPGISHHRGIHLRHLSTVASKHLEALLHSGASTLHALTASYDVVHYHALGPGLFAPVPRAFGRSAVVQTIHGRDDERAKWGTFAQRVLRAGAWTSARVPHATIAVSESLGLDYARRYGRFVHHIPNGVRPIRSTPAHEITRRFGLRGDDYVLFVGRLVPEKAPHLLIRAFRALPPEGLRLVLAGGSCHSDRYVASLHGEAGTSDRIVFAGFVTGPLLDELYSNASVFVLPSDLEGMPLTLLEAASAGSPVVASEIEPHVEVLRSDGPGRRLFRRGDETDLVRALRLALGDPHTERAGAHALREEVLAKFDWDAVADRTEEIYLSLVRGRTSFERRELTMNAS